VTTTAQLRALEPVLVLDRFAPLHAQLISLLRGLSPDDWSRPTACALWSVRDIAAHLLDDDLRRLSFHRDRQPPPASPPASNADLVAMVNRMNAEWVAVARRMSPRVMVDLLEVTGPWVVELFRATEPFAPGFWGVTWAGEQTSPHWFDVGRDYTERWLHQQQIRDVVGAAPLTGREWLRPVLDLFVRALPFAYRDTLAQTGTMVVVGIEGGAGGEWTLRREEQRWVLYAGAAPDPTATITMTADSAWRLFAKQLRGEAGRDRVSVTGDQALGDVARTALAVLA
jgi:uncharacterized protein (TIGR03083 family)